MARKTFRSSVVRTLRSGRASTPPALSASASHHRFTQSWQKSSNSRCRVPFPSVLERLSITDFAVARSVVIEPGPGLNVFTGETGAGKSLVVDALVFVFGGRRGREVIATGAERAVVEAQLALSEGRLVVERSI